MAEEKGTPSMCTDGKLICKIQAVFENGPSTMIPSTWVMANLFSVFFSMIH